MKDSPMVSVILPIRNEAASIEGGLQAIIGQSYPADCIEILVADGMSTDNTREIVEAFATHHAGRKICVFDNPEKIVPTGINIALRQSKGEIILRVDGHTIIAPDYIRQCVEALQRTHADNAGGKMTAVGRSPFGKAVALATSTPFGVGGARFHYSNKEEWVDTVYMGAWPRQVFEKIGLFDEELVRDQDDEFNYRLRQHTGRILLSPAIRSIYNVRSTPHALWRQYYQYGFWKVRVLQKHPRQMKLRQFVPPALALSLLISLLLAVFPTTRPLSIIAPLIYLLTNLGASLWTASQHSWSALAFLPFIFAILHISYGLGFLTGLIYFVRQWGDKHGKVPSL